MTTMAALLGALPLMLGTGVGSELRHPLGITMVGGLIVSQVLTLFTTPVIYLSFDRMARRVDRPPATSALGPAVEIGSMNLSKPFIDRPVAPRSSWWRSPLRAVAYRLLRSRRCPKWTSRPSRCRRRCPARAPR